MTKVLSIAMPSYNVEAYLRRGLESFCDERLFNKLEVIVVDDGSSDATARIAQEFVDAHPECFRLISKTNAGHGSAVNTGLAAASGRYFRIVDGDDWVHTTNLVQLVEMLEQLEQDIVVDERREVHMLTNESHLGELPANYPTNTPLSFEELFSYAGVFNFVSIHTMTAKTEFLRAQNFHLQEHCFYVDYEFLVKSLINAQSFILLPLEIYQYLIGNLNQSVAAQNYVARYDNHNRVLEELLRFEASCVNELEGKNAADFKARRAFIFERINLMIHTQLNIAFIFDLNRKQGRRRAEDLRTFLTRNYPQHAQATAKRYKLAQILHYLGVNEARLKKLKGRPW